MGVCWEYFCLSTHAGLLSTNLSLSFNKLMSWNSFRPKEQKLSSLASGLTGLHTELHRLLKGFSPWIFSLASGVLFTHLISLLLSVCVCCSHLSLWDAVHLMCFTDCIQCQDFGLVEIKRHDTLETEEEASVMSCCYFIRVERQTTAGKDD